MVAIPHDAIQVAQCWIWCGGTSRLRSRTISFVVQLPEDAGPVGGAFELRCQRMGFARNDDKSGSIGWRRRFDEVREHQNAQ